MGKLTGYNYEQFFYNMFERSKSNLTTSFGYTRNLNPNFNLMGKGWFNKDIPMPQSPKIRGLPIITFKFGKLRIWAIPISAPGTKGSRTRMLGHYKVIGYQIDDSNITQFDVTHEAASVYALLAMSLIYDLYLICPTHTVNMINYMDFPNDIDLTKYVFFLHCPMLNEFKLFAFLKTYRLNWKKPQIDIATMDRVYAAYDFVLHKDSVMMSSNENLHILEVTTRGNQVLQLSNYNGDIPEDPLYSELGEVIRPGVTNIYGINFISEPERLRVIIEEKFKRINDALRAKDNALISRTVKFIGKSGMAINGILNDFNNLFKLDHRNIPPFGVITDKYIDIVNSVDAWNFNVVMPIYFYYGDDLIIHLQGAVKFLESVIGPYQFVLSSDFKSMIRKCISLWPWTVDYNIIIKTIISMFQIYFLLLCLAYNKNRVIINNLENFEFNDFTLESNKSTLQVRLDKLFNANISKSTIMDNVYVIDELVVFDPVVNKIIQGSKNGITEEISLGMEDLIYINHNLKLYNLKFRMFINKLLSYKDLDPYLKE